MPYFDEFKVMEEHYIDIKPMNINRLLYIFYIFDMHFRRDLTVSVLCQDLSPVSKHALNKNYYKAHNSVILPFPTERTENNLFLDKTNQWQYFVLIGWDQFLLNCLFIYTRPITSWQ